MSTNTFIRVSEDVMVNSDHITHIEFSPAIASADGKTINQNAVLKMWLTATEREDVLDYDGALEGVTSSSMNVSAKGVVAEHLWWYFSEQCYDAVREAME